MKIFLKLMSAMTLTTVASSSIIACDKQNFEENLLDAKISQFLKLTSVAGKGLIAPTISINENDKSQLTWKINPTNIKMTNLVNVNKTAKDEASFNFLKNVLKIKIDRGTKLEDALFNEKELNDTIVTISDINVDLKPVALNNDFYIVNGSYNIMFTNGITNTAKYKVVTKVGTEQNRNGVIGESIFSIEKTDFNMTFQNQFKVNEPVNKFKIDSNLISMLDSSKDNVKIIFGIEKLINKGTLKLLVTKNNNSTGNFIANDKITVRFALGKTMILIAQDLIVNP